MIEREHIEHKPSVIRFLLTTILFSVIGGYAIFKHGVPHHYIHLFVAIIWVWVTVLLLLILSLVVELFNIDSFERTDAFYSLLSVFSTWWFVMLYVIYNVIMVLLASNMA